MSLSALYYVYSIGIYYNVYHFKKQWKSQRKVTVKHTEMYLRPRNGTKYSASEKKNTDNFTVKIL